MDANKLWRCMPEIMNKMPGPGALLVSGDGQGKKNVMTIGWLTIGLVWGEPVINVMVRPSRYTYKYMQECDEFTVNVMPDMYDEALKICGTKSAAFCDKFKEANLQAVKSEKIGIPSLKDADIILECKTLYHSLMEAQDLNDLLLARFYPKDDLHRIYTAQILNIKTRISV